MKVKQLKLNLTEIPFMNLTVKKFIIIWGFLSFSCNNNIKNGRNEETNGDKFKLNEIKVTEFSISGNGGYYIDGLFENTSNDTLILYKIFNCLALYVDTVFFSDSVYCVTPSPFVHDVQNLDIDFLFPKEKKWYHMISSCYNKKNKVIKYHIGVHTGDWKQDRIQKWGGTSIIIKEMTLDLRDKYVEKTANYRGGIKFYKCCLLEGDY